tara:strand:+ start:146 stop:916 length:771 start_codon:yes stop_codon:yes gene_type:complete
MTEQIRTQPPVFEIAKHFGPFMAHIELPEEVVVNLTKMTDNLLKNSNTPSHGQQLAGVIHDEKLIYQQDFIDASVNDMLEGCVRTYVYESIIRHGNPKDSSIETRINSAWIVSQYQNEYNPTHGHTGCEISGVLYLKTPDVKNRRKIPSKEGKKDHDGDITFTYNSESQRSGELLSKGVMQITPSRGLMLLFPSWLLHQVYPFIGKDERRSIAFNANYKVGIEHDDGYHEWLGGNETNLKLEYTYWDKTKIKGETK